MVREKPKPIIRRNKRPRQKKRKPKLPPRRKEGGVRKAVAAAGMRILRIQRAAK